jgi:hypothetical protein
MRCIKRMENGGAVAEEKMGDEEQDDSGMAVVKG